ncbi:16S rRNA (uracil(1498)-N(3))-methyltransferase [Arcanobacterium haemolyticum]|nr:16S rRNA (uracil(1498)-N(3))-methyltransferase [Arcanobacterium haemolyticum]
MTAPVYVDAAATSAAPGSLIVLRGDEGRHAGTVRRARPGERIDVVDGRGYRARCAVQDVGKSEVTLEVHEVIHDPEPPVRITLVQALAKGGRDEQAVETATEYGAWSFIPWESERAIVSWRNKAEKGRARWEATAKAAAKQSRRSWIPSVSDVCTTSKLVSHVREVTEQGGLVFVCHEEATTSLVEALAGSVPSSEATTDVWFVVGPEGGITEKEIDALSGAGAHAVLLAPHVLRSASAGSYAIAQIAALNLLEV